MAKRENSMFTGLMPGSLIAIYLLNLVLISALRIKTKKFSESPEHVRMWSELKDEDVLYA